MFFITTDIKFKLGYLSNSPLAQSRELFCVSIFGSSTIYES
jgi:hypothetical protein